MNRDIPFLHRLAAVALLGALPVLSGVIPVLDMMVGDGRPAAESHHLPGTHGFPHDHSICIQQQANQWAPAAELPVPVATASFTLPDVRVPDVLPPLRVLLQPRPRAPPAL